MILKLRGKTNNEIQYIKSITFKFPNEVTITLYRNRTEYIVDKDDFVMVWRGVHSHGQKGNDFRLSVKDFAKAEIVHISYDEEAPKNYAFEIAYWAAEN